MLCAGVFPPVDEVGKCEFRFFEMRLPEFFPFEGDVAGEVGSADGVVGFFERHNAFAGEDAGVGVFALWSGLEDDVGDIELSGIGTNAGEDVVHLFFH